jgi:hypothetical protein
MGFQYAGNLLGVGTPIVREMTVGEAMYTGQLAQAGLTGGIGDVQIADVATDAREDDTYPIGAVTGVVDDGRTYVASVSGTAQYGDKANYTATQATIAANGPARVQLTLSIPNVTLWRAPIYQGAWGTALTEYTIATTNSAGTSVIVTSATTDYTDKWGTCYCRTGLNRGIYRRIASISTVTSTITIPFPYTITAGDTFVFCGQMLGYSGVNWPASADCIDGADDMADYFTAYIHELNLEESGKEYAIFSFVGGNGPEAS